MARIFLSPGENAEVSRTPNDVFGVNGSDEFVTLQADSKTTFDPSFNKGGDTIKILGNASLYTASLVGSSLKLTAANGALIIIPIGEVGTTIIFADVTAGRTLYYDPALNKVCLGDQVIEGPAEPVAAGSGGGGGGGGGTTGSLINLSVSHDDLVGTSGDDTFRARVVQNTNGEQTNQLGTGDILNGGAGDDKLLATVQDASPLNDGPSSSIRPETVDVETAHFIALEVYNNDILGQTYGESYMEDFHYLGVEINAAEMLGLDEVGSVGSDSTLTIYNLTTLKDDGVYANRRQTGDICVRMDHTGNGDAVTPAADLIVLFDQDYIIRPGDVKSGSRLNIEIMDMDAAIAGRDPLEDNPFGQIEFTADGVTKILNFGTVPNTYAELETAIRAAITAAAATDSFFSQLTVTRAVNSFKATDTDNDPVVGGFAFGDTITITNSGPEALLAVTMRATGTAPAGKDFHTNFNATKVNVEEQKTEVCVILNKVGRAGDGGDLIIGGMDTDGYNILGGGDSIEPGIQWFRVTVEGDATQDSSLASMKSTNNWLCKVTVESAAGSLASLTIGNSETQYEYNGIYEFYSWDVTDVRNNALKDVLIFDASKFNNGAEVHGYFSSETVAKYMDLHDIGASSADNANAVYSFGSGDDYLSMNLDKNNMAVIGTDTREDFTFTANMGAGNDHVQIQQSSGFNAMYLGNPTTYMWFGSYDTGPNGQTAENWYYNHVLNQNLVINTGEGNDFVETWGATAAQINLGTGNDLVYTDNSGEWSYFNEAHATWVFNSLNPEGPSGPNVNNLQSQVQASIFKAANLQLVVTFQDIVSKVNVGATVGSLTGETVTDLTINQAIKAAINTDPVLSKLLIAEDGPARTLVVRSLIDGEHINTDLTVNLVSSGALSAAQVLGGALSLSQLDGTGGKSNLASIGFDFATGLPIPGPAAPAPNVTGAGRFDSEFGSDGTFILTGADSININNNVVDGGLVATGSTDNDVIVLSSNGIGQGIGFSSTTIGSSVETIDINGVFGRDTILNFTAAGDEQYRYSPNYPGVGVNPTLGIDGYDIFDLTTVIGSAVQFVDNDNGTPAPFADAGEVATIGGLVANNAWVGISELVDSNDFAYSPAATNELLRVTEIAKAADVAATKAATTSVLITVDNATNVGTFYKIVNGVAAGDVQVSELGKIELAQYDHASKLPIGEWGLMTLTNFTPLAPPVLVTTFDQVG